MPQLQPTSLAGDGGNGSSDGGPLSPMGRRSSSTAGHGQPRNPSSVQIEFQVCTGASTALLASQCLGNTYGGKLLGVWVLYLCLHIFHHTCCRAEPVRLLFVWFDCAWCCRSKSVWLMRCERFSRKSPRTFRREREWPALTQTTLWIHTLIDQ